MPLETRHQDVVFDTGVDQSADEAMNTTGLDDAVNLEFKRDQGLYRRPGYARIDRTNTFDGVMNTTLFGAPDGGQPLWLGPWYAYLGADAIADNTYAANNGNRADISNVHVTKAGYVSANTTFSQAQVAANPTNATYYGVASLQVGATSGVVGAGNINVTFYRDGEPYYTTTVAGPATDYRFVATAQYFVLIYRKSSDGKLYLATWDLGRPAKTSTGASGLLDANARNIRTLDAYAPLGSGFVYVSSVRTAADSTVDVWELNPFSGALTKNVGVAEASTVSDTCITVDPAGNVHTLAYRVAGPDVRLRQRRISDLASVASATITPNTSFARSHGLVAFTNVGAGTVLLLTMQKTQLTLADATSFEWGYLTYTTSSYGSYTREADIANLVALSKPAAIDPHGDGVPRGCIVLGRIHDTVSSDTSFNPSNTHRATMLVQLRQASAAALTTLQKPSPVAVIDHTGSPITEQWGAIVPLVGTSNTDGAWLYAQPTVNGTGLRDGAAFASIDNGFRFDTRVVRLEWGLGTDLALSDRRIGATPAAYIGNTAYLGGGMLRFYDGTYVGEVVPAYPPELQLSQVTGTGKTPAGTYTYVATMEWVDAEGRLHRSAVSPAQSITVDGASNHTVRVKVLAPPITLLGDLSSAAAQWRLNIYRAVGSTYWLRYTALGSGAGTTVTLTEDDNTNGYDSTGFLATGFLSDTDLSTVGSRPLPAPSTVYTTGGVVESTPPPPSVACWVHGNRLWLVNALDPQEVWFSKEFEQGIAPEFNEAFTLRLDGDGPIRAGASMDDKCLLFTDGNVYAIATVGGGPTATASGTFPVPELVAKGVGARSGLGAVSCPLGVLFLAHSGFKLLGRDLSVTDVGKSLLDFTDAAGATITSLHVPERQQVWFVLHGANSYVIVFDYARSKMRWTRHVPQLGGTASIRSLAYVAFGTSVAATPAMSVDGNTSSHTMMAVVTRPDVAYDQPVGSESSAVPTFPPAYAITSWLRPDGVAGDVRFRQLRWTARTLDAPTAIQLSVYRQARNSADELVASETASWTVAADTVGSPVMRRWRLKYQNASAIRIRIDITQGTANAQVLGPVLNALDIEFAMRGTAVKQGPAMARTGT